MGIAGGRGAGEYAASGASGRSEALYARQVIGVA